MYYLLLLTLTILFTLIAWRDMRHGIFLIAAALPAYLLRFDLFGLPMTMLEVMVLVVLLRFVILRTTLSERSESKGRTKNLGNGNARSFVQLRWTQDDNVKKWLPPVVLLLLAATIGIFVAPDHLAALGIWKAYFVEPILFFFVVIATIRNKDDLQKLFMALGAGALFVAVFAIFQYATGLGIPEPWNLERRVTSIFPYPNALGLYLGPMVILGIFLSLRSLRQLIPPPAGGGMTEGEAILSNVKIASSPLDKLGAPRNDRKIFWIITSILSFVAIIFAQSEAAIVAVVATLFVASLFDKKLRRVMLPIAVVATILIAIIPAARTPVVQKLTLQDYSGQVRITQWHDAVAMLKDRPIFGAGLSGYPEVIKAYHSTPQNEIFQYPHNIILNIWTELGILGLIAVAWLGWISTSVILRPHVHRGAEGSGETRDPSSSLDKLGTPQDDKMKYVTIAIIFEMSLHGLADVPYFKNDLALLTWIVLAVLIVASRQETKPV